MKENKIFANVLVTAVGGIVGEGIVKSLKFANASAAAPVHYKIYGADMNDKAAGLYRCDCGMLIPAASSPDYIDSIIRIVHENNIRAVYVGSDRELLTIANAKNTIEAESGAIVLTNPVDVIVTARDKWKTYEFLNKNRLPCPVSCLPEDKDQLIEKFSFPLVVKPREGYGSVHFYIVNNIRETEFAISAIQSSGWKPIIQEYLNGASKEYTTGVTIDRNGRHVMSSISLRKFTKSGQTYRAFVDSFDQIRKSAENVAKKLGARGAVNIQAKFDDNDAKVFEINPRFSATLPIRTVAGINEADIVFRNSVLGEDIYIEDYKKMLCLRYWNEIYVNPSAFQQMSSLKHIEQDNHSFNIDYF
jgi:carbamoyl-phosphate synthase large subunit